MRICLMIEGQENVTWEQWVALATACEEHGLDGLFRSDHYLSVMGRKDHGSLDAWATLSALAAVTSRIRLGTLVSPATFRHPSVVAKAAATADHVSGGRIELGLGAGWYEAEHTAYGFDFPDTNTRMAILAEQLEIIHRQWGDDPVDFHGRHYTLRSVDALPKPVQRPHPPIIVGGSGRRRTVELAVKWADEYNVIFAPPEDCARLKKRLSDECEQNGRDPVTLGLSLMAACIVGVDRAEVIRRTQKVLDATGRDQQPDDYLESAARDRVVGTVDQVVERLQELSEAGVHRVMLQHLAHDDLEMVELIGRAIVPAL